MTAATQGRLLGSRFTPAVCVRVTGMGLKQMVQQRVEGGLHAVTFVTLAVCTLRWLLLDPPTPRPSHPATLNLYADTVQRLPSTLLDKAGRISILTPVCNVRIQYIRLCAFPPVFLYSAFNNNFNI